MRVRKEHYEAIVSGEKKVELRPYSDYWRKRLEKVNPVMEDVIAVFICGKRVHRRKVLSIFVGEPEKILDRPLSEKGKLDIPTQLAYVFFLGEEAP